MVGMLGTTASVDIGSLIEYAKDPDKLEKLAEAVADGRKQLSEAQSEASNILSSAESQAKSILDAAKENADRMIEEAREEIARLTEDIVSRETSLQEREAKAADVQSDIMNAQKQIDQDHQTLSKIRGENERIAAEGKQALQEANDKLGALKGFLTDLGV